MYSWGWNDQYQLGRPIVPHQYNYPVGSVYLPPDNFYPKQLAVGDEHAVVLDNNNTLYVWGSNRRGQLGLGHTRDVPRIQLVEFTDIDPIVEIKAKGAQTIAISSGGQCFCWPIETTAGEKIYRPTELCFPKRILIATASCGYNFSIFVAKNGLVFSMGKDNSVGQLGLGHFDPRDAPVLITSLRDYGELVTQVACGYKHVICKTSLGKVYTWGGGAYGQLGQGDLENDNVPRQVPLNHTYLKAKAVQVHAGARHSMILMDNKKIFWAGTNASINKKPYFVEANLAEKVVLQLN